MKEEGGAEIIREHFAGLQRKYPDFELLQSIFGQWTVRGPLSASVVYKDVEVAVEGFDIEITLPREYPDVPPVVREIHGRTMGFHTNSDGTACLGSPLAVKATFKKNPSICGFIDNSVIPYFFSFMHWKKYGNLPFGELSHGTRGLVEYYKDLFGVDNEKEILPFLRVLADDDYRGHNLCPCGSGSKLRHCHGPALLEIKPLQSPTQFLREYSQIAIELFKVEDIFPETLRSKMILRKYPVLVKQHFLLGCYKELIP